VKGLHEARDFVELMATIGEPISSAVGRVHTDNQELKELEAKKAGIDAKIKSNTKIFS